MKRLSTIFTFLFVALTVLGQTPLEIQQWKLTTAKQVHMPLFASQPDVDGNTFELADLLAQEVIDFAANDYEWTAAAIGADSLLLEETKADQLLLMKGFLTVDRWTKGKLVLRSNAAYELYVDNKLVKTQKEAKLATQEVAVNLQIGKHAVHLKLISPEEPLKLAAQFKADDDFEASVTEWSLEPIRFLTIHDVLDGKSVKSAQISASGKYALLKYSEVIAGNGKSKQWYELVDLEQQRTVQVFREPKLGQVKWLPTTDRLSYTASFDGKSDLFVYDPTLGTEQTIATAIEDLAGYSWADQENFIIYSRKKDAEKPGDLKRIYGNDDRLPYFRTRYYLYQLDVETGSRMPLTAGVWSASLHDIHPDGSRILFSTSRRDYSEVPFSKQNLYELNLETMALDTLWKDKLYGGSCQYSPNGKMLLVQGGPECFDELGVNVEGDKISNSYDSQLYLFDMDNKKASSLTYDFDPAISKAFWAADDQVFVSVTERDYKKLYELNPNKKNFREIKLDVDVLRSIDYSADGSVAVYTGSSISSPQQVYTLQLPKGKGQLLAAPAKEQFETIAFGKTTDWNFTNSKGTTIYGRVYYPPNYEEGKQYPLIVNFYGGTSPTDRSFDGRYPKNIWAANGYVVYVMQPSGATGFGQDFSALHVNGWGEDAIDDIIEGTEKFLEAHDEVDAANVGCIGASYGGFTTMLLQTRTKLFKTAISHAGISSISSYWGEGYWGYSYNAGAAKNSYPWSRKDIFVENSPLYNADQFNNSILLLHGTSDTNVPVGESLQYYAALKLLGKDVEMVLVAGEDHWILDYKKRLEWHNTIMSWFDLKLKDQAQQWKELYPDREL